MKNSIQNISFLLIIIASFLSITTTNAQTADRKNTIYISPLNLLNPFASEAQVTYATKLRNNNELQFSYSRRLPNFKPFIKEYVELAQFFGIPESKEGFGLGLEYQIFMKSSPRTYIGIEASFKHDQIVVFEEILSTFSEDGFGWTSNRIKLNLKLGHKFHLGHGFIFDLYVGVGASYISSKLNSIEPQLEGDSENVLNFNFPVNLKLAYSF